MTYNVSSGTLNSTIPYYMDSGSLFHLTIAEWVYYDPVRSHGPEGSPGVEEILSLEWKSEGVMDDESGDDNRDELTSE